MSTPCGHKKNTETVAQYRKRCGGRPLGMIQKVSEAPRKPRKKGQHRNSPNHSDLYTDENPKGTIKGLKFATVQDAEKSVSKIKNSGKSHAHKIQAAVAMEQRAREMGKSSQAAVYRKFINSMKKKTKKKNEGWSNKYKKSIDCNNPKGFSQKAHCAGRKKQESKMSLKLEELVGKPITEAQFDEAAGKKDACYHKVKARYDVWPSAYASGALVKCRKVGAKNWGNKSKKEGVNEDIDSQIKSMMDRREKMKKRGASTSSINSVTQMIKKLRDKKRKMNESYDIWAEDGSFGYTLDGIVEAEYQGRKVKLGKPMQGDAKKFKVYVKNDKGNVVKVNFGQGGDAKGGTMKIRKSNPKARKSFRARHNCDNPGPRWKARYWSCKKW